MYCVLSSLPISAGVLRGVITDIHITSDLVVRLIVPLEAVDYGLVGEIQVQGLGEVQQLVLGGHQVHQLGALGRTEHRHALVRVAVWLQQ